MTRDSSANSGFPSGSQRWLHRFAVLTACATFPLVFVGGLVTSYGVGMAVTDWPTTRGQNMFAYPWLKDLKDNWGVFVEHSHRLLGASVGVLVIVLAVWLWFGDQRRWLRWLGIAALAAVIVQGVLGGLRVIRVDAVLAVMHGCFAQAFFALMVSLAFVTAPVWLASNRMSSRATERLRRLALATTSLAGLQVLLGAVLRHLGVEWVLYVHLGVAFVFVLHVMLVAKRVFMDLADRPVLSRLVGVLATLTAAQLMLGAGAWATNAGTAPYGMAPVTTPQVLFATTHAAVGALILAACVVLTISCGREFAADRRPSSGDSDSHSAARQRRPVRATLSISSLEARELWLAGGTT